ncbi:MAG: hypothetical protein ACP5FH_12000, partial [Terracidiphilus sp.]
PTREYQTDQSSLKPAPAAAGSVLDQQQKQRQRQKQQHDCAGVDRSLHIRTPGSNDRSYDPVAQQIFRLLGSPPEHTLAGDNPVRTKKEIQ